MANMLMAAPVGMGKVPWDVPRTEAGTVSLGLGHPSLPWLCTVSACPECTAMPQTCLLTCRRRCAHSSSIDHHWVSESRDGEKAQVEISQQLPRAANSSKAFSSAGISIPLWAALDTLFLLVYASSLFF